MKSGVELVDKLEILGAVLIPIVGKTRFIEAFEDQPVGIVPETGADLFPRGGELRQYRWILGHFADPE